MKSVLRIEVWVVFSYVNNSTLAIRKRIDFRNHDLVQTWYKLCKSVVGIGVIEGGFIEQQSPLLVELGDY